MAVEPLLGVLNSLLIVIAGQLFRRSCDLIVVSQHVDSIITAYRAPGLRRERYRTLSHRRLAWAVAGDETYVGTICELVH